MRPPRPLEPPVLPSAIPALARCSVMPSLGQDSQMLTYRGKKIRSCSKGCCSFFERTPSTFSTIPTSASRLAMCSPRPLARYPQPALRRVTEDRPASFKSVGNLFSDNHQDYAKGTHLLSALTLFR